MCTSTSTGTSARQADRNHFRKLFLQECDGHIDAGGNAAARNPSRGRRRQRRRWRWQRSNSNPSSPLRGAVLITMMSLSCLSLPYCVKTVAFAFVFDVSMNHPRTCWNNQRRQHSVHDDDHCDHQYSNGRYAYSRIKRTAAILLEAHPHYHNRNDTEHNQSNLKFDLQRRQILKLATLATLTLTSTSTSLLISLQPSNAAPAPTPPKPIPAPVPTISAQQPQPQSITLPLQRINGAYLIYYLIDSTTFRAILDTGSPFLLIPGSCSANTRAKTGCYRQQGVPSGYGDTFERFDGFEGEVQWRKASFGFVNATGRMVMNVNQPEFVFGVVDDDIMSGPGGVFFGLIKNTDGWIRPSFLGQTDVTSFIIDLRNNDNNGNNGNGEQGGESNTVENGMIAMASNTNYATDSETSISNLLPSTSTSPSPSLTLSTTPYLSSQDYIPLNNDLRKKYGDPVQHYVAKAKSIFINGVPLIPTNHQPIYIIFDTGVTGMVVSQNLFNQRYMEARERREKRLWGGTVEVVFETRSGGEKRMVSAEKPLTTPFDPKDAWKGFRAHVIVVGLSFLDGKKVTVDIDDGRLWLED